MAFEDILLKTFAKTITMEDPHLYQKGNCLPKKDASEMIPMYIGLVQWTSTDTPSILDIGCGNGEVTWKYLKPLLPKGTKIVAVDIKQKMLQFAKEHYPDVHYFQLDISNPKIPKYLYNAYDNVFSFHCLHWVLGQKQAMENIYTMLKHGGSVFTYYMASNIFFDIFYKSALLEKWKNYINDAEKYIGVLQHKHPVDAKQYVMDILKNIGFKTVLCEIVERQYVYKNINYFRDHLTAVNPHYSKIPDALRTEFIDDSIHEYYRIINRNETFHTEEIELKYSIAVIVATKPY